MATGKMSVGTLVLAPFSKDRLHHIGKIIGIRDGSHGPVSKAELEEPYVVEFFNPTRTRLAVETFARDSLKLHHFWTNVLPPPSTTLVFPHLMAKPLAVGDEVFALINDKFGKSSEGVHVPAQIVGITTRGGLTTFYQCRLLHTNAIHECTINGIIQRIDPTTTRLSARGNPYWPAHPCDLMPDYPKSDVHRRLQVFQNWVLDEGNFAQDKRPSPRFPRPHFVDGAQVCTRCRRELRTPSEKEDGFCREAPCAHCCEICGRLLRKKEEEVKTCNDCVSRNSNRFTKQYLRGQTVAKYSKGL